MPILGASASGAKSIPNAPTIGTATDVGTSRPYNNGSATVTFTAPASKLPITSYTVTSSPGGFTASGASSPITVTGLQSATAYTFTVTATSSAGISAASSASNSITATTVPQAPTIGSTADGGTGTSATVTYTAGATGGAAISTFTATSSPGSLTGTGASPITVSGLTTGTAYTFTVTATNANGTSTASAASNSVTPASPTSYESIATATGTGSSGTITFSSIPSTYKSLQIRVIGKRTNTTGGADHVTARFNSDSGANYWDHFIYGDGSNTIASNTSAQNQAKVLFYIPPSSGATANMQGVGIIDIIDYASTSKNKTVRSISGGEFNGAVGGATYLSSALWNSTSAINSISFTAISGNFTTTTTFALYGVK
jgi:hypothetical protein